MFDVTPFTYAAKQLKEANGFLSDFLIPEDERECSSLEDAQDAAIAHIVSVQDALEFVAYGDDRPDLVDYGQPQGRKVNCPRAVAAIEQLTALVAPVRDVQGLPDAEAVKAVVAGLEGFIESRFADELLSEREWLDSLPDEPEGV